MVSLEKNSIKKIIGIYPWVDVENNSGDKHQTLFANALEGEGFTVTRIKYKRGFPLTNALKTNVDVLILDWVHSFYTSQSLLNTLVKSFLGTLELTFIAICNRTIIWNLHNLQRHDGKYQRIEKFCFQQLAKKVNYIRVFDQSHVNKVSQYLKISKKKIFVIPQGPYIYENNITINLKANYKILDSKKILLFFGSVRKGKGLEEFLDNFTNINLDDWVLVIAGKAIEKDLEKSIQDKVLKNPNVIFDNRYIPDEQVASFFEQVDRLVLPYQNSLNSGVLLLAKTYKTLILANGIFKDMIGDSDLCGDLFNKYELTRLLQECNNKKIIKNRDTIYSWKEVVNQFKRKF